MNLGLQWSKAGSARMTFLQSVATTSCFGSYLARELSGCAQGIGFLFFWTVVSSRPTNDSKGSTAFSPPTSTSVNTDTLEGIRLWTSPQANQQHPSVPQDAASANSIEIGGSW